MILSAQRKPPLDIFSKWKSDYRHLSGLIENSSLPSLLRINLTYLVRHNRLPDLVKPTTFTELVQLRKLQDRNPAFFAYADKVGVKTMVAERLGTQWVIPTLWSGTELPCEPCWPYPFVVKSRHGCNQIAFVDSERDNWQEIKSKADSWTTKTYGKWLDEWLYQHIPHGLLVEPFIGVNQSLPIDYKFYVFNGRVAFIQVHLDRRFNHRWILFDRNWQRVSAASSDADPSPPRSLSKMIEAAETLGENIDFVRIDLYESSGAPLFGEMTFYPGSGLDAFNPVALDKLIGAEWLKALKVMDHGTATQNVCNFPTPAFSESLPERVNAS